MNTDLVLVRVLQVGQALDVELRRRYEGPIFVDVAPLVLIEGVLQLRQRLVLLGFEVLAV